MFHLPSSVLKSGLCVLAATLAAGAMAAAAAPPTGPAADRTLATAFSNGKLSFTARLRWENADQANLHPSDAFTLSTRLGFTTAPLHGLQAMIQGENVTALNNTDDYNAGGTNAGGAGRTVIADPPVTGLNQAWLSYSVSGTTVRVGRQRIALDNARFIGDVGWRQNMQTFDAATLTATPAPKLTAFYGYVSRVSRVFGNKWPQPDFDSDSHLVNIAYAGLPYGTITAYAYLLDLDNSPANSSNTYGASFAGSRPLTKTAKLTYRLEAAVQNDAANNPTDYRAGYYVAEIGATVAPYDFGVGHEVLGTDGRRKGFATPLATLHGFNGWADMFLATPPAGLRDTYVSAGVILPHAFPLKVVYHEYRSDSGSLRYGHEWNALLTHKIGRAWTLLAKYARFDGRRPFADVQRGWLQVEFAY